MAINNITGSPVEGDNFFGREQEIDFAWKQIKNGNSLILSAPRRVGKTSFAKKILEIAKKENWNTLEINLEEVRSEEGFIKLFIDKLQEERWWRKTLSKTGAAITQIVESIKPGFEYGGINLYIEWQSRKSDIYNKLKSLVDHEEPTLIMVDEMTILLNNFIRNGKENGVNDVEFFLNWLRSFRQVSNTKIQWLFCSSIGIESFTNQYNLSYTLNDVNSVSISEFSNAKATEFIQALSKSENLIFSDNHINHMLKKLGWNLPYFIQLLFSKTNQLVKIRECELAESTINVAYQMLISEKHLNTWDERLKEYSEHESSARLILRNLSRIQDGETRQTIFNLLYNKLQDEEKTEMVLSKLLYMLKNDGYINDGKGGRYLFRSPLLRDFWFHKFVK